MAELEEFQSRNEAILRSIIDGTEYVALPQSRIEELLLQLKEVIVAGGGSVSPEDIQAAIEEYLNTHDADIVTEAELTDALDGKQDVLTFDSAPTQNSSNPVTSGGVYTVLANVGRPTDAQVQTAVNNYLENSGIGTMGTMADFKSYVMGE